MKHTNSELEWRLDARFRYRIDGPGFLVMQRRVGVNLPLHECRVEDAGNQGSPLHWPSRLLGV